jgi:hypothetical protein
MAAESRNQTKAITLQSGTPAGKYEVTMVLDRKYDGAVGWLALPNSLGGASYARLGLRDETYTILDLTNIKFLDADAACPKRDRWTPLDVKANGTNLYLIIEVPTQLTSALQVDVVFNLFKA